MKIISSTGGSGSSFVVKKFEQNNWLVCTRPDGGQQKSTHTTRQIYDERTGVFYQSRLTQESSQRELFNEAHTALGQFSNICNGKIMLMCMTWGGLGYLNNLKEKTIFLLRDPVYAFNSYSGGGWRKEGGARRIKYVGATGPNDKKWIDLWLNDFALWKNGSIHALKSHEMGTGDIVRYHNFEEDWQKIKNVPNVCDDFVCRDELSKLDSNFISEETIDYIRSQTSDVWNKIKKI